MKNLDISTCGDMDELFNNATGTSSSVDYTKIAEQGTQLLSQIQANNAERAKISAETRCTPPQYPMFEKKKQKAYEECLNKNKERIAKLKSEQEALKRQELELRSKELQYKKEKELNSGISTTTIVIIASSVLVLGIAGLILYKKLKK
jgi:hypothetical protein